MMKSALIVLVLGTLATVACEKEQDFATGLRVLCDAKQAIPNLSTTPPAERFELVARYTKEHVRNREVLQLLKEARDLDPTVRNKRMREAVKKAGIERCELLEPVGMMKVQTKPE